MYNHCWPWQAPSLCWRVPPGWGSSSSSWTARPSSGLSRPSSPTAPRLASPTSPARSSARYVGRPSRVGQQYIIIYFLVFLIIKKEVSQKKKTEAFFFFFLNTFWSLGTIFFPDLNFLFQVKNLYPSSVPVHARHHCNHLSTHPRSWAFLKTISREINGILFK